MTNLHWGILCDQGQALNTFRRLHRHYRGNLSPQAIAEYMSFFNPQGIHCAQYSLGHLNPIELDTVHGEAKSNLPSQSRTVLNRVGLLSGRDSDGR